MERKIEVGAVGYIGCSTSPTRVRVVAVESDRIVYEGENFEGETATLTCPFWIFVDLWKNGCATAMKKVETCRRVYGLEMAW